MCVLYTCVKLLVWIPKTVLLFLNVELLNEDNGKSAFKHLSKYPLTGCKTWYVSFLLISPFFFKENEKNRRNYSNFSFFYDFRKFYLILGKNIIFSTLLNIVMNNNREFRTTCGTNSSILNILYWKMRHVQNHIQT
jgi:hypothetical protein